MPNTGYETVAGRTPLEVENHTVNDTLTASESGTAHTNKGAPGITTYILPAAVAGMRFTFSVGAAFELRIDPAGTEKVCLPSTGVPGVAGKYLGADAIGETVELRCFEAGVWGVVGYTGTWTAEA